MDERLTPWRTAEGEFVGKVDAACSPSETPVIEALTEIDDD